MKSLWSTKKAKCFENDDLSMRVYSSRLLGKNPELVLHGGGNTSVKGEVNNQFGETIETLFIKGSGWDLISIEKEGFAPVDLQHLIKLSHLSALSDSEMVAEQKLATLKPNAPNPSVEAILHAIIPYKFVDHTHSDAVLTITNTPNGKEKIKTIYGNDIVIIPYVMPGFILTKKIVEMTKNADWEKLKGMILLKHGVFSFGHSAKDSYEKMIEIVSQSENYLKRNKVWRKYASSVSTSTDVLSLASIRKKASDMTRVPCLAKLNNSKEAVGFSKRIDAKKLCTSGTLTPDHVIRTKPFAWVIEKNLEKSSKKFMRKYSNYFNKHKESELNQLDNGPKWALWPDMGTICFGKTPKEVKIISDINRHSIRAVQVSQDLDKWVPLSFKELFKVEYWDLEQAKLQKANNPPEFRGKIAIITGASSGIGKACTEKLLEKGCAVIGLDKNPTVELLFENEDSYKGIICDLTISKEIKGAVQKAIMQFGGVDILISNAGIFSKSALLEKISDEKWKKDLDINLTTHHKILRECIPYLKQGIHPSVIFVGSRNVGAPGPGAGTYTIAKSGLNQMSRLAAIELANENIRVNTVHPDCVYDTAVWSETLLKERANQYDLSVEDYKKRNILKTEVSSEDVAELISFMVSNKFMKTTGAQIPIDGGNDRII